MVKTEAQTGPVITESIELLRLLSKLEITDSSATMEEQVDKAIELLNCGDTIHLEMTWAKNSGYIFAPKQSKIYRYRNKSIKKILRRFFDKKLEVTAGLSSEDESAFLLILFERNLPYRISGYGTGIDSSLE